MAFDTVIKAGETLEVTDKATLDNLLNQTGIEKAVDPKKVQELEGENEKLKKELELAKAKERALELGIKFSPQIGLAKLLEKIAEVEGKDDEGE